MKYFKYIIFGTIFPLLSACSLFKSNQVPPPSVLIFSKTSGYRHIRAIEAGKKMFKELSKKYDFGVNFTEDATKFTDDNLKQYRAVIFLNVSGPVFNQNEKTAFQRFIEAGGGFLAIHGPTDALLDWPWYVKLIGAVFESHPKVQKGTYVIVDSANKATQFLPYRWTRTDEFYNFKKVNPNINVLIKIDENTYKGGTMGNSHPMVWYHNFDGGRSFYIGMGHTQETYSDSLFRKMIWGGLQYVMQWEHPKPLDYSNSKPKKSRFNKQVLVNGLNEPIEMSISNDGRIFLVERRGDIKVYIPSKDTLKEVGIVPVFDKYEDGLLGIALDPNFSKNKWLYVYYTAPGGKHFRLSRFTLNDNGKLDNNSEKIMLNIPKEILDGSHTGGGLIFNKKTGDLYVTVGDNTSPRATRYAPLDERPGRKVYNAARSAGNTNNLRGKILRIHPETDGTYSIPKGNLFSPGTPKTRPEIYTMGNRQPWRLTIDSKTGWLYWGEVGPDGNKDSTRGPKGYDEFNMAKKAGNYGWPYVIGPNRPYNVYNFVTGQIGEPFDPQNLVNDSRYNTGLKELPPSHSAFIWYPYGKSNEFPLLGSGGRTAIGGPIFRQADFQKNAANEFPPYYEGKWFIADFIRHWIRVVSIDKKGKYQWIEKFMGGVKLHGPMDMEFGPDGSLYVLDYGEGWFRANKDAGIIRISYNSGNLPPVAHASANVLAGGVPLKINLSSKGSKDPDNDKLYYRWAITSKKKMQPIGKYKQQNPTIILDSPGIYEAKLIVTDDNGDSSTQSLKLFAGNNPPDVKIKITKGNRSFFFPQNPIQYKVEVKDREDGSLIKKEIKNSSVSVSINYYKKYDPIKINSKEGLKIENPRFEIAIPMFINKKDCYSCHQLDKKSIGPSFMNIAERYSLNKGTVLELSNKIIEGGNGNWGQAMMSAHPSLPKDKAELIVKYILTRNPKNRKKAKRKLFPTEGQFIPGNQEKNNKTSVYVIRASYIDKGNKIIPPLTSYDEVVLHNPILFPQNADFEKGLMSMVYTKPKQYLMYGKEAYIGYKNIDLTGISNIIVKALPVNGGHFEIHLGSPNGKILGRSHSKVKIKNKSEFLYDIKLSPSAEFGNIYLVAKNDSAKYYNILYNLKSLEFKYK